MPSAGGQQFRGAEDQQAVGEITHAKQPDGAEIALEFWRKAAQGPEKSQPGIWGKCRILDEAEESQDGQNPRDDT